MAKIKLNLIVPVQENLILPIMFSSCSIRQNEKSQSVRVLKMICTAFRGTETVNSLCRQKRLAVRISVIYYIRLWTGFPIICIKFSEH